MIVIPPRRSALSAGPTDGPWAQREASLQRIRKVGRREWQMDVTPDLEILEDGALSVRTAMEPLGELTISTHGRGEVVSGSVKVVSDGPVGTSPPSQARALAGRVSQ